MFLRSRDGKRIVEARDFEVKGTSLFINGAFFEESESDAAALAALVTSGRELASLETVVDLSGEIEDEDDFDFFDDDDEYEDEDELIFGSDEEDADLLRRMFQKKK